MYNRQKLLLQVINCFSKKRLSCGRTYLMKALFLLKQRCGSLVAYDFFPYHFGPYSQAVYDDFNYLEKENLLEQKNLCLTNDGEKFIENLKMDEKISKQLNLIFNDFSNMAEIKKHVYSNYPAYTIRSKELDLLHPKSNGIYSIGYEGKSLDAFTNDLIQNNVSLLVDVRRNAFSMKKGFSKSQLDRHLRFSGIKYLHMPALGIESEKRKALETMDDYKQLFREYAERLPDKKQELEKLEELGKKEKIALMCFEADKNCCHRGVISNFLKTGVVHI